jgi:hypothetical protein
MALFGLMTVAEHERVRVALKAAAARDLEAQAGEIAHLKMELDVLKAGAEEEIDAIQRIIADLTPDAQLWRDARQSRADKRENRKSAKGAV